MRSAAERRRRLRLSDNNSAIMAGEVDLTEWDDEELKRGRRRDKNGNFQGRPSKVVPREVYNELRRRTATEFHEMVRQELIPAMEVVVAMARGDVRPDPVRLKACEQIIDRFAGKAPQHVSIEATVKPYEEVLEGGIVRDLPDEDEDDEDVIDAEVVDEE